MNLREVFNSYPNFKESVEAELRKLAEADPDFVYNPSGAGRCSYNSGATDKIKDFPVGPECKGCIFGQALQNLGWDDPSELTSGNDISALMLSMGYFCPKSWMGVQGSQDDGNSWGVAIKQLGS